MNAEKQPNFRKALNDKIKQMKKELNKLEWLAERLKLKGMRLDEY